MGANPIFKDIGNPCTVRAIQISGGMLFQMTREKVCFQSPIRWLIEGLEHPYSSQCYLMGRKHWRNMVPQIMKSSSMKDFVTISIWSHVATNATHTALMTHGHLKHPHHYLCCCILSCLQVHETSKQKAWSPALLRVRSYMNVYNMAVREFWHTLLHMKMCFKKEELHGQYKELNFVF